MMTLAQKAEHDFICLPRRYRLEVDRMLNYQPSIIARVLGDPQVFIRIMTLMEDGKNNMYANYVALTEYYTAKVRAEIDGLGRKARTA